MNPKRVSVPVLLSVDLVREVPEQRRPRKIQIGSAGTPPSVQDNSPKRVEAVDQQHGCVSDPRAVL